MLKTLPPFRSKAVSLAATACIAILFLISSSAVVQAQGTATKPKAKAGSTAKKDTGSAGESIKVGDKFPSLKLKDQDGKAFDLAQTLKKGPVALVIFRSADW